MESQKNTAASVEAGSSGDTSKTENGKQVAKEARASTTNARQKAKNDLRKLRMERMISKAELARRAAISTLTIDRVERGLPCRMDTKRKILEALGLGPEDRAMVFGDDDD